MQAGPEKKFKMFEEGVVDRPPPLFDPRARRGALPPAGVAAQALETRATCVPRALAACASASHTHARARERPGSCLPRHGRRFGRLGQMQMQRATPAGG